MEYPRRKQVRLQEYDYSTPGAYYVTICTHEKRCILSTITAVGALHEAPAASVELTAIGRIVQEQIDALPIRYPNLTVTKSVVMPNHIHLLVEVRAERALHEAPLPGKRAMLSKAIGYLKMNSSKRGHALFPELKLWQRSFYEHVIRNDCDYEEIWNYIENNPFRWADDLYHIQ